MVAFSKDAFVHDQDVADMWFVIPDDEYPLKLYVIDGDFYLSDESIANDFMQKDPEDDDMPHLFKIMYYRHLWYCGEKLDEPTSFTFESIRELYDTIDFPTSRDARCPFICEGCLTKRCCPNCGMEVSICDVAHIGVTEKHTSGMKYFCTSDCWSQYNREKARPFIEENRDYELGKIDESIRHLVKLKKEAQTKGRVIHLKYGAIGGKTKVLREELDKQITEYEFTLKSHRYMLNCSQSLLNRDKNTFDINFQLLQEWYVDKMADSIKDEHIMRVASSSKKNVAKLQRYSDIFLGTRISDS